MEKENLLKNGLKKVGFSDEQIENIQPKMDLYINEIALFNSAYNLTNTSDYDELVTRHILDSLSAYKTIKNLIEKKGSDVLIGDIGSGGGLPGIPLSIAFPNENFRLVERMSKRCAFLENCSAILRLKNVEIMNLEAEQIPSEFFDIVVFRAFRPLDKKMTKTLLKMTKNGGKLVAYKAKLDSINEEMNAIKDLVPKYEIIKLNVPGLEQNERNLVIIEKEM